MTQAASILPGALTTFFHLPSATLLSIAYQFLFHDKASQPASFFPDSEAPVLDESLYMLSSHPHALFKDYHVAWIELLRAERKGWDVQSTESSGVWLRCDLRDFSRTVQHHFLSEVDGHQRTYIFRVESPAYLSKLYQMPESAEENEALPQLPAHFHLNNHRYSSVCLVRESDGHLIPYESIWGITLIMAFRINLDDRLRDRAYSLFLKLPLYEDMAPWNILITGEELTYIDHDTKTKVFDQDMVRVYYVLEAMFNYKRTIEDFNHCGDKAGNPVYNFDIISDCVSSKFDNHCTDPAAPIACGDGTCKTDYISCLRDMNLKREKGTLLDKYI